jgi:Fur family peroxide stress response transcriptional regulator
MRSVLKDHGLRYSKPREVILGYLLERDRHVSAEGLYLDLKQRGEVLSLSTVYLNLSALAEAGLVREYKTASGQSFYDSNVTPHYHVVCNETGAVMDVPAPEIDGVPLGLYLKRYVEEMTGWQVDEPRFSLTGVSAGARSEHDALTVRQPADVEPAAKA